MQARWAKPCKSRPENLTCSLSKKPSSRVVPPCYQPLHAGEPEGEASSIGLEGGLCVQECWAKEAKERPGIHVVLKRLQHLYKDHRSRYAAKAMSAPPA